MLCSLAAFRTLISRVIIIAWHVAGVQPYLPSNPWQEKVLTTAALVHSVSLCFSFSTDDDEKRKKGGHGATFRPFTPIHSCIISPSLPEARV